MINRILTHSDGSDSVYNVALKNVKDRAGQFTNDTVSKIKGFYQDKISPLELGSRSIQFGVAVVNLVRHTVNLPLKTAATPIGIAISVLMTVGYGVGMLCSIRNKTKFEKKVRKFCEKMPNRIPAIFTRSILNTFITPMRMLSSAIGLITNPIFNCRYNAGKPGVVLSKFAILTILQLRKKSDNEATMTKDFWRQSCRDINPIILNNRKRITTVQKEKKSDEEEIVYDQKVDFFGIIEAVPISSKSKMWPIARATNYLLSSAFWRSCRMNLSPEMPSNDYVAYKESKNELIENKKLVRRPTIHTQIFNRASMLPPRASD